MIAEIVVCGLVAYRIWRLIAVDTIGNVRDRTPHAVQDFLACGWCSGFWITAAVGIVPIWETSPWLLVPAAAVVVGYLSERI